MPVLPRLAAAAAALLLLASPLSATLPAGSSWTLTGVTKATASAGGVTRTERMFDTVHLDLPGPGGFSLSMESEPGLVFEGTLVEDGGRTLLVADQASRDAYLGALIAQLEAMGIAVLESSDLGGGMRARVKQRLTGEEMRVSVTMRWSLTTQYDGRTKRIGVRVSGHYRGPEDA